MSFRPSYALPALSVALAAGAVMLAASALGMGLEGCTILTNDALPDDAGSFEAGDGGASTACVSCVTQECTGAWAVCLTDARCIALRACNNPFGESQGARDKCFCDTADAGASTHDGLDSPDGGADPLAAYGAFASCNDARTCGKCAADCTATCASGATKTTAGSCGSPDDAGTDADAAPDLDAGDDAGDAEVPEAGTPPEAPSADRCSQCASDRCGDQKKACAIGSECSTFLGCSYGCADASCVGACGKAHSTGKESATELANCTLTSCRSACGY